MKKLKAAVYQYQEKKFAICARLLKKIDTGSLKNPDAVIFLRAQCLFYSDQPGMAEKDFTMLQKRFPNSPHADLAAWRKADCEWELKLKKQAVRSYAYAASHHPTNRADGAVGLARRSLFLYEHGDEKRASWLWFVLRKKFPLHPLATDAPPAYPEITLTFDQSMQLARAMRKSRAFERALAMLEGAIDPALTTQKLDFIMLTGLVLFDTRDNYQQSANTLFQIRDRAKRSSTRQEAWFYGSRALGRADKDKEAIASHLAMVKTYPKGKYAPRALFYAGWLYVNQDRCDKAHSIFQRVSREYSSSKWAKDSAWFDAWCHINAKQWDMAIKGLAPLSSLPGYEQGGRASYWRALALDASGKHEQANKGFSSVIRRYPLTWYSWLARIRLGKQAPPLPSPPEPSKEKTIHDPLLARTDELTSIGLWGFANQLLRQEEKKFLARHPTKTGLLAIMQAYTDAKNSNRPWFLTLTRRNKILRSIPNSTKRIFWQRAYPSCERDTLIRYARDDTQLVLLLQAIMRTESGFDQMALSSADARGLMQMIPSSASLVAQKLHLQDFSSLDLFDPNTNIRIATWYIGQLTKKFKGQWPIVAAAYNASPKSMMRWLDNNPKPKIDEFVEQIPYTESRRYAKRVFTAMLRYAWLEKKTMPTLNLQLDTHYLHIEPNQ